MYKNMLSNDVCQLKSRSWKASLLAKKINYYDMKWNVTLNTIAIDILFRNESFNAIAVRINKSNEVTNVIIINYTCSNKPAIGVVICEM